MPVIYTNFTQGWPAQWKWTRSFFLGQHDDGSADQVDVEADGEFLRADATSQVSSDAALLNEGSQASRPPESGVLPHDLRIQTITPVSALEKFVIEKTGGPESVPPSAAEFVRNMRPDSQYYHYTDEKGRGRRVLEESEVGFFPEGDRRTGQRTPPTNTTIRVFRSCSVPR